jgi:hypothetical protein
MSRKIILESYENNTVYGVSVFDSYGTEHHLGDINANDIGKLKIHDISIASHAHEIWSNEVKPEENLLGNAIAECIEIDKKNNIEPNLD